MVDQERSEAALDAFYAALLSDDAEALYERAPCGYLSTTPDGMIVKANQTFLTWTGWAADELVGRRRFVDLLTAGGLIYHETHYATSLRMHDRVREVALDLRTPDGRRLPALVNAVLERADDGTPLVVRTVVFDASERRRYELELLAAKQRAEEAEARALDAVRTLQQTLLPRDLPEIPDVALDVAFQAAGQGTELGGDFYDVVPADGGWLVVIGDVCGKGLEAATVTALARHTIWAATASSPRARDVMTTLNDVLRRRAIDRYTTVALVGLRAVEGRWTATVCAGGHPLPLLARRDEVRAIGRPGSLVGVFDDPMFHEVDVELEPADVMVLYTDGITEARRDGELFGEERLHEAIRRHRAGGDPLAPGILADVLAFQAGSTIDDAAVLTVQIDATS